MMGRKEKLNADEMDGIFGRHFICSFKRAGATKKIKRNLHKKERSRRREGLFLLSNNKIDNFSW